MLHTQRVRVFCSTEFKWFPFRCSYDQDPAPPTQVPTPHTQPTFNLIKAISHRGAVNGQGLLRRGAFVTFVKCVIRKGNKKVYFIAQRFIVHLWSLRHETLLPESLHLLHEAN